MHVPRFSASWLLPARSPCFCLPLGCLPHPFLPPSPHFCTSGAFLPCTVPASVRPPAWLPRPSSCAPHAGPPAPRDPPVPGLDYRPGWCASVQRHERRAPGSAARSAGAPAAPDRGADGRRGSSGPGGQRHQSQHPELGGRGRTCAPSGRAVPRLLRRHGPVRRHLQLQHRLLPLLLRHLPLPLLLRTPAHAPGAGLLLQLRHAALGHHAAAAGRGRRGRRGCGRGSWARPGRLAGRGPGGGCWGAWGRGPRGQHGLRGVWGHQLRPGRGRRRQSGLQQGVPCAQGAPGDQRAQGSGGHSETSGGARGPPGPGTKQLPNHRGRRPGQHAAEDAQEPLQPREAVQSRLEGHPAAQPLLALLHAVLLAVLPQPLASAPVLRGRREIGAQPLLLSQEACREGPGRGLPEAPAPGRGAPWDAAPARAAATRHGGRLPHGWLGRPRGAGPGSRAPPSARHVPGAPAGRRGPVALRVHAAARAPRVPGASPPVVARGPAPEPRAPPVAAAQPRAAPRALRASQPGRLPLQPAAGARGTPHAAARPAAATRPARAPPPRPARLAAARLDVRRRRGWGHAGPQAALPAPGHAGAAAVHPRPSPAPTPPHGQQERGDCLSVQGWAGGWGAAAWGPHPSLHPLPHPAGGPVIQTCGGQEGYLQGHGFGRNPHERKSFLLQCHGR
ncbi:protein shisa-7 isoform X2 [Bos javanicus]|uniref:protein shisa-7 isoform X2 n=1 Tax=Bos javanicus TaxID=9906 RepID=UPI002AA8862B|nr:protein shisa-7 isoform X2 [Bos javanicus]